MSGVTGRHENRLPIVIVVVLAILWLVPVYAMVTTSLKTQKEVSAQRYLSLPASPQVHNFAEAFAPLKKGLVNSMIISFPATFLCVLIGSFAAYFLTMFDFRYSTPIFFSIVFASFLPYQVVLIPLTQFMNALRLLDTYTGLILAYLIVNSPMATLIIATFFMKAPKSFLEAAAIDGCRPFTFYRAVLVPMSIPGIVSAAILVFVQIYNEFLLALALTLSPSVQPVMPTLASLRGSQFAQWQIQMAGAIIVSVVPLIVFIFLSRYFISGLMAGYSKE
jgi:glucose/mannose transport system permease protein